MHDHGNPVSPPCSAHDSGACSSGMATPTRRRCEKAVRVGLSSIGPFSGPNPHPYPLRAATSRPSPSGRPRRSATQVPRRWGRETGRIQARGRPFADVPLDGARHTALRRRVGTCRVRSGSTPERPIAGKAADDAMTLHRRSKRLSLHGRAGGSVTAARRPLCRDRHASTPDRLGSIGMVSQLSLGQTCTGALAGGRSFESLRIPLRTDRYAAEGPERGAR